MNWTMFKKLMIFIVIRVLSLMIYLSITVLLDALGVEVVADYMFVGMIVFLIAMGIPEELYVGIFKNVRLP